MGKLQRLQCPKCGNWFDQNSYNHQHCNRCSYEISIRKGIERARMRRQKAKQS